MDVWTLKPIAELTDSERAARRKLAQAVYPPAEQTNSPGRHLEWAAPEWCVCRWGDSCEMVSHVGVITRRATYDGQPIRIGGVGGVMTHPAARGRGYAGLGIQRAIEFLREQCDVEFALLVCRPELIAYYSSLGWDEFRGQVLVQQHGSRAEFTFNQVMTCAVRAARPIDGIIDLCGPPW